MGKVHHWFVLAGTNPAVAVKTETNDFETLKSNCQSYARIHKAAIWAVAVGEVTGILAWPPRVEDKEAPCNHPRNAVVELVGDPGEIQALLDKCLRMGWLSNVTVRRSDVQLFGHPRSAIVGSGEGTNYCAMCEEETRSPRE